MNTIGLLQLLSDIAVKNYNEGIHPDPYAARVAHTLAIEAAAKYSPESADAAAFVAISTMIDLSRHSLQQADLEIELHDAMKSYNTTDGARVNTKLTIPAFNMIAKKPDNRSFGRDGSDIYDSTFDSRKSDNYRLALHAACSIYTHSYACARAAYTHAVAVAAQYPVGETRNDVFKKHIRHCVPHIIK
jgi:hypothetical protein